MRLSPTFRKTIVAASVLCFALALTVLSDHAHTRTPGLNLPDMGDSSGSVITPSDEAQIGAALLARLRAKNKIIEDPEINDYISYLGGRVAAQTDQGAAGFRFFVVNDDSVNAFAAPGGFIGIHTGLFKIERTEGELAAVLAHETAHVTQRHLARTFEMADRYTLPVAVALISAVLIGGSNSNLAQAAITGTIAGQAQSRVDFTREHEREADRVGLSILVAAGYDAHNMVSGFQRLLDATKIHGQGPPEYLRTHPLTTHRIAEVHDRASRLQRLPPEDDLPYQLARAKLRILSSRKRDALAYYAAQSKHDAPASPSHRYGLALAYIENDRPLEALPILDELSRHDPERTAYHIATVDALNRSGQAQAALKKLETALRLWPGSYPLGMLKARILVAEGEYDPAIGILARLAAERPDHPGIFELASLAKERNGDRPGAYLDLARQYELLGRIETAVRQMRLAQRLPNLEERTAASIDARLRRLERLEKALKN